MNRKQRRKQAALEGKTIKPSAIITNKANVDLLAQEFESVLEEARQEGYEAGYQKRKAEQYNEQQYSDGLIVHLMDAVETWRLHCHTVDTMVKAKLSDRQLKTVIDLTLRNEIESSYEAIKKAWQAQSDLILELSGVGLTDFDTLRPDIKAATEARTQAIDELYTEPGSAAAIKALQPVNVRIVDFINPVKMGRVSLEEKADYVTLEAIRLYNGGNGLSPNKIQKQLIREFDSGNASPEHLASLQELKLSRDPVQLIRRRLDRAASG